MIERKHQLEGEIKWVSGELRRRRGRGAAVTDLETRLARLRNQHHHTRLAIDKAKQR